MTNEQQLENDTKTQVDGTLYDFPNQTRTSARILAERGKNKEAKLLVQVADEATKALEEINELHKKYLPK